MTEVLEPGRRHAHVRFGSKADIERLIEFVRLVPKQTSYPVDWVHIASISPFHSRKKASAW